MKPGDPIIVNQGTDREAIYLDERRNSISGRCILVRYANLAEAWVVESRVRRKGASKRPAAKRQNWKKMPSGSIKNGGIRVYDDRE